MAVSSSRPERALPAPGNRSPHAREDPVDQPMRRARRRTSQCAISESPHLADEGRFSAMFAPYQPDAARARRAHVVPRTAARITYRTVGRLDLKQSFASTIAHVSARRRATARRPSASACAAVRQRCMRPSAPALSRSRSKFYSRSHLFAPPISLFFLQSGSLTLMPVLAPMYPRLVLVRLLISCYRNRVTL